MALADFVTMTVSQYTQTENFVASSRSVRHPILSHADRFGLLRCRSANTIPLRSMDCTSFALISLMAATVSGVRVGG